MAEAELRRANTRSATPRVANDAQNAWVETAVLAASGAFTASSIIPCRDARTIHLWVKYQAGVIEGYPQIILMVSGAEVAPALTDDEWYAPQVNDGAVVATELTGAMPASHDATLVPEWGSVTARPLVLRLENGAAATDRIRTVISLPIEPAHHAFLLYAEEGASGTPGTIDIDYSLSI